MVDTSPLMVDTSPSMLDTSPSDPDSCITYNLIKIACCIDTPQEQRTKKIHRGKDANYPKRKAHS